MKKILFGLIALALLVGMTGVVSANDDIYCKVTGGGTVDGFLLEEDVTVAFTAQGIVGSTDDVKGKVTIVDHNTKTQMQFDVVLILNCWEFDETSGALIVVTDDDSNVYVMVIEDNGEGANAVASDLVFSLYPFVVGPLSGNAQVKIAAPA